MNGKKTLIAIGALLVAAVTLFTAVFGSSLAAQHNDAQTATVEITNKGR
jgi:hypothetical protein